MNRKGFTLIELVATLVVLGLVMTVVLVSVTDGFGEAKTKSEDVFVETIKDAMDMYLSSDARNLWVTYTGCKVYKKSGVSNVYKRDIKFSAVINSTYKPITQKDLVNPANKDVKCNDASSINVTIYRDEDYVYYYSINKSDFGCLVNMEDSKISNLPEGFACN